MGWRFTCLAVTVAHLCCPLTYLSWPRACRLCWLLQVRDIFSQHLRASAVELDDPGEQKRILAQSLPWLLRLYFHGVCVRVANFCSPDLVTRRRQHCRSPPPHR